MMEYNTQREKLKIIDYGRNVLKLIEYCKTMQDRETRNKVAATIVEVMAQLDADSQNTEEYKRKLWVHLMILADWNLDVDIPFEINKDESVEFHPRKLEYKDNNIQHRHFGRLFDSMIKKVEEYPEGPERDQLTVELAHYMKRCYLVWNRSNVEDELLLDQFKSLSDGKLVLKDDFAFLENKVYLKDLPNDNYTVVKKKNKKKKK